MALGEPLAVRAKDGREMRELRHRPAQRFVQRDLLGSVRKMIVAADHVRDLHQRVVDDDHVVVDRHAG